MKTPFIIKSFLWEKGGSRSSIRTMPFNCFSKKTTMFYPLAIAYKLSQCNKATRAQNVYNMSHFHSHMLPFMHASLNIYMACIHSCIYTNAHTETEERVHTQTQPTTHTHTTTQRNRHEYTYTRTYLFLMNAYMYQVANLVKGCQVK